MIVGLCDTQIGDNPPILTKKLTKTKTKKSVEKSVDFFCLERSADFFVGGEIVWWDTSFRHMAGRVESSGYTTLY